jgi:L-2-hydroxyglutarate oxidase
VIYAGVYYPPDSLKAQFCRLGLLDTISFCKQYNLPYRQCGKLLVATEDSELEGMDALFKRSQANQLCVQMLNRQQLKEHEPNIQGLAARDVG